MGRNRRGANIRVHAKSKKKAKEKLKRLISRSQGRKLETVLQSIKVFMQGWLGYYGIADMKKEIKSWNEWLRRRIRMYLWSNGNYRERELRNS
ncbi:MAG: hypothetical protein IJA86_06400 [Clostridia bacterium]|nr:hypothetical protein [Clostridia bacterium]